MLDWHQSLEIQRQGRQYASQHQSLVCFFRPNNAEFSKNIWENCARVICEKPTSVLNNYLDNMLEWLQDMNWPGADIIMNRLICYEDVEHLLIALRRCINAAYEADDEIWLLNIFYLLQSKDIMSLLPAKEHEIILNYPYSDDE